MASKLFPTFEIGSLAKPLWRTKSVANIELNENDIEEAKKWGKFLDIEYDELIAILQKRKNFTKEEKKKIIYFSSYYATRLLEKAGLDWIYDGEQHRIEMYQYPLKFCEGFKLIGEIRSFDNKYYNKAAVIAPVRLKQPYHVDEINTIKKFATKKIKIPITGPYTLAEWSYDEYYTYTTELGSAKALQEVKKGKKRLLEDIAFNIIRKNNDELIKNGVEWIQIDEPALTTKADEVSMAIEILSKCVEKQNCIFSIHICFSDYNLLFPYIEKLEGKIKLFALEFANRDTKTSGVNAKTRKGYEILSKFKEYPFSIGVGVIDVHTDFIEPPQLIRDRILWACELLKDPQKVYVNPDCGLRTRSWQVAYQKLSNLKEGQLLATKYF